MGGCCCSCLGDDDDDGGALTSKESELVVQQDIAQKSFNRRMSSPGITVAGAGDLCVTGAGLALIGTALEQDAAYWEFHISLPVGTQVDTLLFGVTTKKGRQFYEQEVQKDEEQHSGDEEEEGQ